MAKRKDLRKENPEVRLIPERGVLVVMIGIVLVVRWKEDIAQKEWQSRIRRGNMSSSPARHLWAFKRTRHGETPLPFLPRLVLIRS